jgi:hypothetical protein
VWCCVVGGVLLFFKVPVVKEGRLTLTMKAVRSFETSGATQPTTQHLTVDWIFSVNSALATCSSACRIYGGAACYIAKPCSPGVPGIQYFLNSLRAIPINVGGGLFQAVTVSTWTASSAILQAWERDVCEREGTSLLFTKKELLIFSGMTTYLFIFVCT